jgi:hypothetical protein
MTQARIGEVPRPVPQGSLVASDDKDPPLKDVLVELWENTEKLIRQELALASAELELKAHKLKAEIAASAIGAALMFAGALALVAGIILLLELTMPAWLAALVTSAAALAGGFVLLKTRHPSLADLTPDRTMRSVKKDLHTFKEASND